MIGVGARLVFGSPDILARTYCLIYASLKLHKVLEMLARIAERTLLLIDVL
jgi:hypothetical protein